MPVSRETLYAVMFRSSSSFKNFSYIRFLLLQDVDFRKQDVAVDNTYEIRYTLGVKLKRNRFRINLASFLDFRTDETTISLFRNEVNGLIRISLNL